MRKTPKEIITSAVRDGYGHMTLGEAAIAALDAAGYVIESKAKMQKVADQMEELAQLSNLNAATLEKIMAIIAAAKP